MRRYIPYLDCSSLTVVPAIIDKTNSDWIYQFILSNSDLTVLSIEY